MVEAIFYTGTLAEVGRGRHRRRLGQVEHLTSGTRWLAPLYVFIAAGGGRRTTMRAKRNC